MVGDLRDGRRFGRTEVSHESLHPQNSAGPPGIGEVVPVDGTVESFAAVLDESVLTGESLHIERPRAPECAAAS